MSDDDRTRELLAVGAAAGIHRIPVPTPFAVGKVNVYLIADDPLTIVDTGPNSATSLVTLEEGLRALGHRSTDIERIVITHQHIDHTGLVGVLARRSGAEVCALAELAPFLADYERRMEAEDAFAERLMLRHGIPMDMASTLRATTAAFHGWGAAADVGTLLREGDTLAFADRTLRVHHRPGHSPSDIILVDESNGLTIAGDHLLSHISSNPVVHLPLDGSAPPGRPHALLTYIDSLKRTAAEDLDVVFGGHGPPLRDHAELIAQRLAMHDKRAAKIHGLIERHPRSAHDIALELWHNVAVTQAFLTLSEVLGHVDLLISRGEAVELDDGGDVVRFAAA